MEKEIVIKGNDIIRIYSIEEWKEHFKGEKYVSMRELIEVNKICPPFVHGNPIIVNYNKSL